MKIILGMAYANEPWKAIISFKKIIALGVATGTYISIFSTPWQLSLVYEWQRFILLMTLSLIGMIGWLVYAHNFWEFPSSATEKKYRYLYNITTLLTMFCLFLLSYIILFLLLLTSIIFFVPDDLFKNWGNATESYSVSNYLRLSWFISSAGLLAGALGSVIEGENTMKEITYTSRQRGRKQRIQRQLEKEETSLKTEKQKKRIKSEGVITMKKKVGILTAPDLAKKLADKYYETLPSLLSSQFDSSIEWEVEVIKDSITGAAKNFIDLYTNTESYAKENNWSYVINLTDLPILDEKKVIAADINKKSKTILLSVSAFGWGSIRKRVERAILYAMKEVYYLSNDNNQQGNEYNNKYYSQNAFPSKRLQRKTVYIEDTDSYHIRYLIFPSFIGKLQLVSGMVSVNKPLNMMKTLTSSLALSFTTGAFGLIFTTLWQLSYIFSELRLLSLSFASIFAMLIWIILAHQLWDIPAGKGEKHISKLYNFTTLITLFISVSIYYITLFILFLITCLTILPADFVGKTIGTSGPADFIQYIEIAWLTASIATVAGAVGVGLTNEKLVKESTFSYRQQSRYENIVNKKSEK
ncbi:hypothetical protein [Staphylococcus shinii]